MCFFLTFSASVCQHFKTDFITSLWQKKGTVLLISYKIKTQYVTDVALLPSSMITFHSRVVPAGAAVCVFIGVIVVSRVINGFVDASTRGVIRLPTRTPCDVSCVRSRCRCARVVVEGMTRRCDCSRRSCCSILNFQGFFF